MSTTALATDSAARPRLLDRLRHARRVRHYSSRTEDRYVEWATRFIRFLALRHPNSMGGPEIEMFLTDLAVHGQVSASSQNQAFHAPRRARDRSENDSGAARP